MTNQQADSSSEPRTSNYLQEMNNNYVDEKILEPTFYDSLMDSFSLQKNWKTIMDDSIAPDSIPIINGIKYEKFMHS